MEYPALTTILSKRTSQPYGRTKTVLICLLAAVAMRFGHQACEAQGTSTAREGLDAAINHAYPLPKRFSLEWKLGDEWRIWLTAVTIDHKDEFSKVGWHPSMTALLSDYKPLVKKLKDGRWQIQFTSEIAQDVP